MFFTNIVVTKYITLVSLSILSVSHFENICTIFKIEFWPNIVGVYKTQLQCCIIFFNKTITFYSGRKSHATVFRTMVIEYNTHAKRIAKTWIKIFKLLFLVAIFRPHIKPQKYTSHNKYMRMVVIWWWLYLD